MNLKKNKTFIYTLNRRGPSGGFAYGIFVNALIGRPLYDRRYRPINLLPFDNVTRSSLEIKVDTNPIPPTIKRRTYIFGIFISH